MRLSTYTIPPPLTCIYTIITDKLCKLDTSYIKPNKTFYTNIPISPIGRQSYELLGLKTSSFLLKCKKAKQQLETITSAYTIKLIKSKPFIDISIKLTITIVSLRTIMSYRLLCFTNRNNTDVNGYRHRKREINT